MSGLDLRQFRDYIVDPALRRIGLYSQSASVLLLATAMAESGLRFIDQVDKANRPGPAYGFFQMERATHDDIWRNYLDYNMSLSAHVRRVMILDMDAVEQLHGNALYAAAMCRVHYRRVPKPLPEAGDVDGMARYWKEHYNTRLGKGTLDGFKAKAAAAFEI